MTSQIRLVFVFLELLNQLLKELRLHNSKIDKLAYKIDFI